MFLPTTVPIMTIPRPHRQLLVLLIAFFKNTQISIMLMWMESILGEVSLAIRFLSWLLRLTMFLDSQQAESVGHFGHQEGCAEVVCRRKREGDIHRRDDLGISRQFVAAILFNVSR